MNLTNFLKQTDALTTQYSTEQLLAFIHDIARVFPKHSREEFLDRLRSAGGKKETASNQDTVNDTEFSEMYSKVRNNLKLIDSQEVMLVGILNDEYHEWYDDGEEYDYEDRDGISDMIEEARSFIHTCMRTKRYQEGLQVGKQMLSMEILCDNDYGGEELTLAGMVRRGILHCDLKQVILDTADCIYRATPLKKRPEALYKILADAGEDAITLESMMQHGDEELPDFEDFLTQWVIFLGGKMEEGADRLIVEAAALLDDLSQEVRYAERFAESHPRLFLDIMENRKCVSAQNMVLIGMTALKAIPKKYVIRSRAALETAKYAIDTGGEKPLLEKCYFAAYESDTSVMNYFRALFHGYECEEKRKELQEVYLKFWDDTYDGSVSIHKMESYRLYPRFERKENKPDRNTLLLLKFLDGQFADVLEQELNTSKALGWSETFMKPGIAVYLLYMHEGSWNGKGITAMAGMVKDAMRFLAEEYRKGTREMEGADEDDLFFQLFTQWKSIVQMDADVREHAICRITDLMELRTAGIIDANRRNYYGECAAYIAALGEVRESMGEIGAKQRLMTSYKYKYSRRSSFCGEMRRYGWIDVKRK